MKEYKTNILSLASYLFLCKDRVSFKGIDKTNLNRMLFIFEPFEVADELKNKFYNGKALVDAQQFIQAYSALRDLLFEEKKIFK